VQDQDRGQFYRDKIIRLDNLIVIVIMFVWYWRGNVRGGEATFTLVHSLIRNFLRRFADD
jgi:hypothetical protein